MLTRCNPSFAATAGALSSRLEYFPILSLAVRVRLRSGQQKKYALRRVPVAVLWLIIAATAALLAMDAGCYLWLRANDAHRATPNRRNR